MSAGTPNGHPMVAKSNTANPKKKAPPTTSKPKTTTTPKKTTTTTTTKTATPKASTPKLTQQEMAQQYGWALAFLKSVPELWKLFQQAVKGGWSTSKFQASLKSTKWYKAHGETYRKNYYLKTTDPKTYKARLADLTTKIADLAGTMGVNTTSAMLNQIAEQAFMLGWGESQIKNALAKYVQQVGNTGHYGGDAGRAEDELRQYAYSMGVQVSDGDLKSWISKIAAGTFDTEHYKAYIQSMAESAFPHLAEKIKAGVSVAELAEPYKQAMASILELNAGDIDLFDNTIRGALQGVAQDGKSTSIPLWEFERQLRKDPRWQQTNNAYRDLNSVARQVAQNFGFAW